MSSALTTYSTSNSSYMPIGALTISSPSPSSTSSSTPPSSKSTSNPVMSSATLSNQRYVKLNVGGRLFSTSIDTLTKQDNMLRAMFSGRMDLITDLDGYILIDRCGKHFELVLNYLRDEDTQGVLLNLDDKSDLELYEILKEAKFYCVQSLVSLVEQKILSNKQMSTPEPYYGSSVVSMITSKIDLIKILTSTDKPCIRLLINRHNNKYSYTNNSDDNLLKNIELFERMAIKFKNRIMFIKDTTSNEEICCWYFHGGGKKLAEVCCTSIVYTTEKKQTKVEFPDSKILEEIFVNAVLFESKETANNNNESSQTCSNMGLFHNGISIDDESVDEMPRISLGSRDGVNTGALAASSSVGCSGGNTNNGAIGQQIAIVNTASNTQNVSNVVGINLASLTSSSGSLANSSNTNNGNNNSNNTASLNSSRRGTRN